MVTGVIVTPTGTVTDCPFVSLPMTSADPGATASIAICVVSAADVTGVVTVTTPVAVLETEYWPR